MDEIESLYVTLGLSLDDSSVSKTVNEMTDQIKQKLKSSIYGGKKGVITLPATIKGTYKDGREIEKEIVDAYTAIYNKAKEMADKSVSLTLDEVEDFTAQINKFGKMTVRKRSNDAIANANNNLQQTIIAYRDLVNDLKEQIKVQQKQIAKSKPSVKKQKSTSHISNKEITNDAKQEQSRKADKKIYEGLKGAGPADYKKTSWIDPSRTNDYEFHASEYSPYTTKDARRSANARREEDKKTAESLVAYISKEMAQNAPTGRKTTSQEQDRFMNSNILRQFGASLADLSKGKEGITPETVYQNLVTVLKQFSSTNQALETTFNAIKNIAEYNKSDNPRRRLGGTYGTPKGVGPNDEEAKLAQKTIYKALDNIWDSPKLRESLGFINIFSHSIEEAGEEIKKTTNEIKKHNKIRTNNSQVGKRSEELKAASDTNQLVQKMKTLQDAVVRSMSLIKNTTDAIETQISYDKIEHSREAVADTNERKVTTENKNINRDVAKTTKIDTTTGFNTDANAIKLLNTVDKILSVIQSKDLHKALNSATRLALPKPDGRRKKISDGLIDENLPKKLLSLVPTPDMSKALSVIPGEFTKTLKEAIHPSVLDKRRKVGKVSADEQTYYYDDTLQRRMAEESNKRKEIRRKARGEAPRYEAPETIIPDAETKHVEKSRVYASPIRQSIWDKFEKALENATGATKKYEDIINATADEQDQFAAERIKTYGLNNGRNPNDTGDIANIKRALELFRTNKRSIEENPELAQNIKLTPGVEVDTTKIVEKLSKALSGRQMRDAQMGGSIPRQILGGLTGFIGMPSLEKSRAQADGLNQILGNINKALQSVLINIQMKETELSGMEKSGEAKFDSEGHLQKGSSSAAYKTLADLEEEKLVLDSILADMAMTDKIVSQTGGKFSKLVKQLSFTSPVLRENNGILRNMNAGLDKNGKALKFQTRTAEILNYTFQLMSRSIGQVLKNWLSMANPINLIKRAFNDFTSYNVKWQRTMNVIKYNLRTIIQPMMDDIAQKLVNMIGFVDIISQKIQAAFGKTPISLFDQAAADTEKMREELEAASNVSAGFDELHDIGSDNSGANDLLGDIYKPQLSPEWQKLAEDIGDLFAHVIKGDMGFGGVMATIVKLLGQTLGAIAKIIWEWFKNTAIGKYIITHWKSILLTLTTAFLAWKLLKIGGKLLFNTLFGDLTGAKATTLFSSLGTKLGGLFGKTLYTGAGGSIVTVGKLLGGLTLTAVGTAGAITTAVKSGSNWQDMSTGAKIGSQALQGVFSAATGLGAVLLGASGPVGWGVALATFAASAVIGLAQVQDGIGSVKKETKKLQETHQVAKEANDAYLQSMNNLSVTMSNLEQIEKQTGLSGAELDKQVKDGVLTIDQMTTSQMQVYNAYLQNQEMIKQLKEITEAKTQADKQDLLQTLKTEAANAIAAKSYDDLRERVVKAWQDGSISAKEAGEILSRTLANANDETQRVFGENLPEEINNAFKPEQYESGWRKFGNNFKHMMNDLGDWFSRKWDSIKAWWNNLWGSNNLPSGRSFSGAMESSSLGRISTKSIASFAVGTNYIPNDGLAYLHQGEAVIPKKYNQAYQPGTISPEEKLYMRQMINTMKSLDSTMKRGINVNGEFTQRGSDLVAVVNKTKSQTGADLLSNVAYAR